MRADIHGGPEQKLQSEAGYIDARPQTDSSTKTSCNAGAEHTNGSNCEILAKSKCFPLFSQQRTFGRATLPTANLVAQLASRNRSSFAEMAPHPGFTKVDRAQSLDRPRMFFTCIGAQVPPRGVGIPRSLSTWAMARSEAAPAFCAFRMSGSTLSARSSAAAWL